MGLFDFFSNKKKEREQQEQLKLQQEEEKRKAEEKRQRERERERQRQLKLQEEENKRKLEEKQKEQKRQERERFASTILERFNFDSNCHQRYKGSNPENGLQKCPRYIKIRKNINGCSGYQLKNGDGYILTAVNGDTGNPQFTPKPMRIVKVSDKEILLKGYVVSAQTPFGWQEIDMSDYGFSIELKNGKPEKCTLHMYDKNVKIEYRIEKQENYATSSVALKVMNCIHLFEQRNIPSLQQSLYVLYNEFNCKGGGRKIIGFERKDQLCECFDMMLVYDWMNSSDIREVWAEDGFYCISEYLNKDAKNMQDFFAGALDLFLLLCDGERNLCPKINDILTKARYRATMSPMSIEGSIFSQNDFYGGATYMVRQFKFFAATIISKVEKQHPQVISSSYRTAYENAKTDFEFATIPVDKVLAKMNFFASIIGSILEDM